MCVLCGWFKMLTINNNNKQFLKRAASYLKKKPSDNAREKSVNQFLNFKLLYNFYDCPGCNLMLLHKFNSFPFNQQQ